MTFQQDEQVAKESKLIDLIFNFKADKFHCSGQSHRFVSFGDIKFKE